MNDAYDVISQELGAREKLLWSGRPKQGIVLRASDAYQIPLGLIFIALLTSFLVNDFLKEAPTFFIIWTIAIVFPSFYMISGRFIGDAVERSKIYYGVTEDRIIIVSGYFQRKVKTLNLRTISDISFTNNRDRRGTITFGPLPAFSIFMIGMMNSPGMGGNQVPSFDMIEDPKTVYDLINNLLKKSSETKKNDQ